MSDYGRNDGDKGGLGFRRRKVSPLYSELDGKLDYKDSSALRYFVSERGKVVPRRISRLSAKDQRKVAKAVKRARALGLIPFTITGA